MIKQINKESFSSFKKVREMSNSLFGSYQLYSKNGFKYIGKHLSKYDCFATFRNQAYPILRYLNGEEACYLIPLHGESIANFAHKSVQEREIGQWIHRFGSVENCLWEIAKLLLRLIEEQGLKEVVGECLKVYNG